MRVEDGFRPSQRFQRLFDMRPAPEPEAGARLRQAIELRELGVFQMENHLRRRHPDEDDDARHLRLLDWLGVGRAAAEREAAGWARVRSFT